MVLGSDPGNRQSMLEQGSGWTWGKSQRRNNGEKTALALIFKKISTNWAYRK
jgi:hypothetical protein